MFTHTRNLFSWQKLHSATEWQQQNKKTEVHDHLHCFERVKSRLRLHQAASTFYLSHCQLIWSALLEFLWATNALQMCDIYYIKIDL